MTTKRFGRREQVLAGSLVLLLTFIGVLVYFSRQVKPHNGLPIRPPILETVDELEQRSPPKTPAPPAGTSLNNLPPPAPPLPHAALAKSQVPPQASAATIKAEGVAALALAGPREGISCLAFTPDASIIAAGGGDKTIRLWKAETGELLKTFEKAQGIPRDISFSPNGKFAVTVDDQKLATLWNVETGTQVKSYAHGGDLVAAKYFDDTHVAIAAGSDVLIWETTLEKPGLRIAAGSPISCVGVSTNGKWIVTGQSDLGMVRVWSVEKGEKQAEYRYHSSQSDWLDRAPAKVVSSLTDIRSVEFMDLHRVLVAGSRSGTHIWEWEDSRNEEQLEMDPIPWKGSHAAGSLVFGGAGASLLVVDTSLPRLAIPKGANAAIGGRFGELKIASRWQLIAVGGPWVAVAGGGSWGVDGKWKGGEKSQLQLIKVESATRVITAAQQKIQDRERLAKEKSDKAEDAVRNGTATRDQMQTAFQKQLKVAEVSAKVIDGFAGGFFAIELSPDGKYLAAAAGDHTVRLFDTATWKEVKIFRGHSDVVTDISFSADGKKLLSMGWDKAANLWDVSSGTILHRVVANSRIQRGFLMPDGAHAVTGGVTVQYWDLEKERLNVFINTPQPINGLAVSSKGLVAATTLFKGCVIWDPQKNQILWTMAYDRGFGVQFKDEQSVYISQMGADILWSFQADRVESLGEYVDSLHALNRKFTGMPTALFGPQIAFRPNGVATFGGVIDQEGKIVVFASQGAEVAYKDINVFRPGRIFIVDPAQWKAVLNLFVRLHKDDYRGRGTPVP